MKNKINTKSHYKIETMLRTKSFNFEEWFREIFLRDIEKLKKSVLIVWIIPDFIEKGY